MQSSLESPAPWTYRPCSSCAPTPSSAGPGPLALAPQRVRGGRLQGRLKTAAPRGCWSAGRPGRMRDDGSRPERWSAPGPQRRRFVRCQKVPVCHGHGLPPCRAAGSLHLGYQLTPTPCAPTLLVSGEGTGLHHSAAVAAGRQTALHTRTHTHGTDTRPGTGASSSKQKLLNLLTAGEAERPRGAAARKPPLPCAIACTCHPVVSPLDMGRRRLRPRCSCAIFY